MKRYLLPFILGIIFTGCMGTQKNVQIPAYKEVPKVVQETVQSDTITSFEDTIIEDIIQEESVDSKFNVALIFPSKIMSKYGVGASQTISAYLMQQDVAVNMEVFDCIDQEYENLLNTINKIKEKNITNVIALLTPVMADHLINMEEIDRLNIYIPTVNKKNRIVDLETVIFGGIDYEQQIDKLIELSHGDMINFYSKRGISRHLTTLLDNKYENILNLHIDNNTNYEDMLIESLQSRTIFLNTAIVKSSIVLSQIRANELEPYKILSTQLNYSPLLISLTQKEDREQLFFANSIGMVDEELKENIRLLGADIEYDWVNYSTLIGIDYLLRDRIIVPKLFDYTIEDGQVQYNVQIVSNDGYGFKPFYEVY